ncbi:hypothetical protein F3Y22_tig00110670pilonHSYRG00078 [Hibiscus syriacus]|uniref:Reverse transcriptase domain-containing protein n=1 Tax=Hibiscus syriacus TaxID=106335 RepID=A0A6A2ZXB6_HIBSY|nr:hypothetical protein F3Y22_tig00110670pilonHSYRG00078 [Hibiscus syriacus]
MMTSLIWFKTKTAFRSRKRVAASSTFSFVRFRRKSEADLAVRRADGRIINGFKIRVFHDNKGDPKFQRSVDDKNINKVWLSSIRDSRSFKEVVGGDQFVEGRVKEHVDFSQRYILAGKDNVIHVMFEDDKVVRKTSQNGEENKIIRIAEKEVVWRQSCLVGKIKNMYNEDIVQTAFCTDGLDVKVSILHELLVVLQFKYESARQVCWQNREHWVSLWFNELELLEGYENKLRVKTWILLSDVPLLVWSESFFMNLGSLWGKVLLVDEDTCNRSRFDVAKILLEVQCASEIPEKVSIVCNGRLYSIKITTEAQEESRMFIDGLMSGGGEWCPDAGVASKEKSIEDVHVTGSGSEDAFNSDAPHASHCQRSENVNGLMEVSRGLGEAEVERRVVVNEALHEVPIFENIGPKDLFADDSVGYMELNRDGGHVWKTQSVSNSSRLLDIPIDELIKLIRQGRSVLVRRVYKNEAEATFSVGEALGVVFSASKEGRFERGMIFTPAEGASGGLITLWDSSVFVMNNNVVSRRIVALKGRLMLNNLEIGIINVYGPNLHSERYVSERIGASDFPAARRLFEEFISRWDLFEVPTLGSIFTWFRGGSSVITSRLDRIIISPEIACLYPDLVQLSLPRSVSDHNLVVLKERKQRKIVRPFKWFNHWAEDSILVDKIKFVWESNRGNNISQSFLLTKAVTKERARFLRERSSDSVDKIGKLIEELETRCISNQNSSTAQSDLVVMKARLWSLLRREEHEWLQKSRLRWFKEGDRNTKFFHLTASSRAKRNQISKLKMQNLVLKQQARIQNAFVSYFRGSFNKVKTIPVKIGTFQLRDCVLVREGCWKVHFQRIEDQSFSKSYIALIPKVNEAVHLEDFIPISLIADCILIANEVIDDMFKKKKEAMIFKADFSKAYDTVDWNFLNFILKKMGFGKRWRKWVYFCISTPSIAVLVNGCPSSSFSIKRGLRQGCPLSPMLFNVVGEALSGMLLKASANGLCEGVGVGSGDRNLSHIQFADDLLIFSAANVMSLLNFNRVLKIFELAAGLKLNMKKSKIFGINVNENRISSWANLLNCGWDYLPTTYLGLPLGHKNNSKTLWQPVLDKVQLRLQNKYNYGSDSLVPKETNLRNASWVWRNIINQAASFEGNVRKDFICVMGNGDKIDFWNDHWSEMLSLKVSFPRIFGLAQKKSGNISEFGNWINGVWVWKIELRRGLFDWETDRWSQFLEVLNRAVSSAPVVDKLKWIGSVNGMYTPKSFWLSVSTAGKLEDPIWKFVWCKFVPPKVSSFVWKAVHQRLPIWQRWCFVWNISMMFPSNVKDLLQISWQVVFGRSDFSFRYGSDSVFDYSVKFLLIMSEVGFQLLFKDVRFL